MPAGALPPDEGLGQTRPGPTGPDVAPAGAARPGATDADPVPPDPVQLDTSGAGSAVTDRSQGSQGSVRRELAGYTALRLGLIAVLSVAAHLTGLLWLPSVALGVVAAALLSLLVLRRPMRRLAAAMAGRSQATARPSAPGGRGPGPSRSGAAAYDPYEDDPYEDDPYDDDPDDDDPHQAGPGDRDEVRGIGRDPGRDDQGPGPAGQDAKAQDAKTIARPTSSP